MRKYMFSTLVAGCAAIAVSAAAQDEPADVGAAMSEPNAATDATQMTAAQNSKYGVWSEPERTIYNGWAPDHQAYFWTLNPQRQTIYWRLSEADRATIAALAEADSETAWMRVESQVANQAGPSAGATSAPPPPESDGDPTEVPPME